MQPWDSWIKDSTNRMGLANVAFLDPQDPMVSKVRENQGPAKLSNNVAFVDPQMRRS